MPNYKKIDLNTWKRKEHFLFFKQYEHPFFNLTANIEVDRLYKYCKEEGLPFSLVILHNIMKCLNEIEQFRYRVVEDELVLYDRMDVGTTILNEDETFSFINYTYDSNESNFITAATKVMEAHRKNPVFSPMSEKNVVYFSAIPWVSYNHISHAQRHDLTDYIPRLSVGKYFKEGDTLKMPFSVQVHHALCDGLHVGRLFQMLEQKLAQY